MKLQETRELLHYWNRLRRGSAAPDIVDLETAPGQVLPGSAFLIEVDRKQEFPFRLASESLNALAGVNLTHHSFVDLWRGNEAANMAALLANVVAAGCPVLVNAAATPLGEAPAEVELLLLPLRSNGRAPAFILGLAACTEAPAWLGELRIRHLAMRQLRLIRDEDFASVLGSLPSERSCFPQRESTPRPFEQRGHLRVYPGGRRNEPGTKISA
jgi:hypothetical protein